MDELDTVVFYGGSVKALGDGRVGGYLVRFTDEAEPDMEGEFFTAETFYGDADRSPVYYQHGMDKVLGKRVLSQAALRADGFGVWVETQLELRDEYEKWIYGRAEAGKMGWSSGTAGHLIERVPGPEGKATWIKSWPLGLDASITPTPAEPKNVAMPLKSVELTAIFPEASAEAVETAPDAVKDGGGDGDGLGQETVAQRSGVGKIRDIIVGGSEMGENAVTLSLDEYVKLIKGETGEAPPDPEDVKMAEMSKRIDDVLELIKNSPAAKNAGYVAPDSETDHAGVKSFGDFLVAVANKNLKRLASVYGSKSVKTDEQGEFKAALAEDAGATGGYLVPTEFEARLLEISREKSIVRASGASVIPMTARQKEIPALDVETAPGTGESAFLGGVVASWTEEAAAKTETEPAFRMITLTAHKLAGYTLASNEVSEDSAVSLEALLYRLFGDAIAWHEDYAFLRGTGVGQPLGILNSGALISVASRSAASAFALADAAKMMASFLPQSWNTGAWFIAPDLIEKLIQQVAAPLAWMTDLRAGLPMTYLGKPIYVTEKLPALNTPGDVLLVDPSYYVIGDRTGVAIAYSEHYKFINDQGTWRFVKRVDGQPWVNAAITLQDGSRTVSPFVALAAG